MAGIVDRIEKRLQEIGLPAVIEESDGTLVVSGMVTTDEERLAVLDVVAEEAPDYRIDDNIETSAMLAEHIEGIAGDVVEMATEPGEPSTPGTIDEDVLPGDFQNQRLLHNARVASGADDNAADDEVADDESAYVPPTDPVRSRDGEVLGGFAITSMDHAPVARSSDGTLGDEAIATAVRRELREDAATSSFEIEVRVSNGVVHLRGRVPDMIDSDSVEEVAGRVEGVIEVRENLEVEALQ